ncbi:PREDICTED: glutaredoxin domain-containing cysteine-rich protein CG31559-like isoform X1 [Polistes dominula]|uniref:Glutaredoxin domain-containing cysteine-rich protein CG31559-like isoform X1 n=2 Tax=Polistes dominula TaxID=743375 RepID=A0ABM1HZ67_POLDO|nr:PREDICTED: glutaredoxin domain-containing cysteine-rich protein CG31559-like isoform X1 [Polistes dominula]
MQSVRMDEVSTMTVLPPLPAKTQSRDGNQVARQTVSIRAASPPSSPALSAGAGATVFVGSRAVDPTASIKRRVPEIQTSNGYGRQTIVQHQEQQHQHQLQQASHIVKIKINPDGDKNGKVISAVRLTLDGNEKNNGVTCERSPVAERDGAVLVSATNLVNENLRESGVVGEGCVRISVGGDTSRDKKISSYEQDTANNNDQTDKNKNNSNNNNNNNNNSNNRKKKNEVMVQRATSETPNSSPLTNRSSSCIYYNSYQNPLNTMVMSSGQCSPSDTLDSGTCSDLDGTPPPLPKKKNINKNIGGGTRVILSVGKHDLTGSLTSSGAELDSDDNESNISCDSLNGGELNGSIISQNPNGTKSSNENDQESVEYQERIRPRSNDLGRVVKDTEERVEEIEELNDVNQTNSDDLFRKESASPSVSPSPSRTSTLSKASSTPRIRSPELFVDRNGSGTTSPVVRECTYEERKQEQERIEQENAAVEFYANYNRSSGNKYVYDDDRFYKFHLNELRNDNNEDTNKESKEPGALGEKETDECFAGYKILEREAIRSAKGTVRGVKNRVRAGIATFLQKPSSKAYKAKEEGKVVVYTTSSGIVRLTFYNCMKVKQILNTHMVKYEEKDLFRSAELQTELRDRIGCTAIQVPQLFVGGQYIGDADTVERLNESGELRRMLKPYQSDGACPSCLFCGNYRLLVCPVCNGSKRSVLRNDFTVEFVALKCMNCDETGLVPCQHC